MSKRYPSKKFIILRLPGILGVGVKNIFIQKLVTSIKENKQVKLNNLNKLFNSCLYVEDLVFFIKYLLIKKDNKNFVILNLSSNQPIKLKKILNLIIDFFSYKKKIKTSKDSKTYIINNSKSEKYGFKPRSTYSTIIKYLLEIEEKTYL
jgi:nucleoside-diphosphate-sugar epimerase